VLQIDAEQRSVLHYLAQAEQPDLDAARALLAAVRAPSGVFDRQRQLASALALEKQWWDLARLLSPTQALSEGIEQALQNHSGVQPPDRLDLIREAVRLDRIAVAQALMKLGAVPQPMLHECVLLLGDRMDKSWLQALRQAGLHIGASEREPLLPLLSRQQPCPVRAIACLLEEGASLRADAEADTVLTLLAGAALDYDGQEAPAPAALSRDLLLKVIAISDSDLLAHIDASGKSALAWAAAWADAGVIAALLQRMQARLNAETLGTLLNRHDADGQTVLLSFLRRSDLTDADRLDGVRMLVQLGADPQQNGGDGQSPRALALRYSDDTLLQLLAWPNGAHPRRPLFDIDVPQAARRADIVALRRLLALGLDVNALDEDQCCALAHAAGQGDKDMLDALLQYAADPNQGQQTALHCALRLHARAGQQGDSALRQRAAEIVERLKQADADPARMLSGLDALSLACALIDLPAVQLLLRLFPELAKRSSADVPALHAIARACYFDAECDAARVAQADAVIECLLSASADINVRNAHGASTLHLMLGLHETMPPFYPESVQAELVRLLIGKGADVQALDYHGRSALHACCQHRLMPAARELLNAGADPFISDRFGKQASDLAGVLDRFDFLALFRGDAR
jgi:uncharacterized protein